MAGRLAFGQCRRSSIVWDGRPAGRNAIFRREHTGDTRIPTTTARFKRSTAIVCQTPANFPAYVPEPSTTTLSWLGPPRTRDGTDSIDGKLPLLLGRKPPGCAARAAAVFRTENFTNHDLEAGRCRPSCVISVLSHRYRFCFGQKKDLGRQPKPFSLLVGAGRFELPTPTTPLSFSFISSLL